MKQRRLLTPTLLAELYGIDRMKVYNWIRNKRFPYIKPNKELLIWQDDFEHFLKRNTITEGIDEQ